MYCSALLADAQGQHKQQQRQPDGMAVAAQRKPPYPMQSTSLALQDYCANNPDEISRIAACQRKVDDVKNIMVENIEKVRVA